MTAKIGQTYRHRRVGCAAYMHEHHQHVRPRLYRERLAISRIREEVREVVTALSGVSGPDLAEAVTGEFEQVVRVPRLAPGQRAKLIAVIEELPDFGLQPYSGIRGVDRLALSGHVPQETRQRRRRANRRLRRIADRH